MSPEEKQKEFRGKKLFWSAPPDKFKTEEEKQKDREFNSSEPIIWSRKNSL